MPRQSCNWMPHLQPQAPHMTLQDGQSTARLELTICVLGQLGATVYLIGHGGCAGLPNGDSPDNPLQQLEVIRLSCQICFGLAAALTNVCSQKRFFYSPVLPFPFKRDQHKQIQQQTSKWHLKCLAFNSEMEICLCLCVCLDSVLWCMCHALLVAAL